MTDGELLTEFVHQRSQGAFAELARRHVDWVYSAALRQMHAAGGDTALAQDVTQAVFIVLALKAPTLARRREFANLAPWLFTVLRHAGARALRAEQRRKRREQEVAAMRSETIETAEPRWREIAPLLEELLARLPAHDRAAVLLRFYEKHSFVQVGAALGIGEEAARKRVDRALEKLRSLMSHRGIVLPAAALALLLLEGTSKAAPATTALLAAGASTATTGAPVTLAQSVIRGMLQTKLTWTALAASILLLLGLVPLGWLTAGGGQNLPPTIGAPAASGSGAAPNPAPILDRSGLIDALNRRNAAITCIEWTYTDDIHVVNGKPLQTSTSRYARMGTKVYAFSQSPGTPDVTSTFDGTLLRQFMTSTDPALPSEAVIGRGNPGLIANGADDPPQFTGRYVWLQELPTLLNAPTSMLTDHMVPEDGASCYEVICKSSEDGDRTCRLLLDPQRSFMPRRIESILRDANGTIVIKNTSDQYAFQEAHPAMWFPSSLRSQAFRKNAAGILEELTTNLIHARIVSLNQDLPPERFALNFPNGTRVDDESDPTGTLRTYIAGNEAATNQTFPRPTRPRVSTRPG